MFIQKSAEWLAWTAAETVEELSVSIFVDVDADPMFSTTVGRICVAYYDSGSFLYSFWQSITRKHSQKLSASSPR